MAYHWSMRPVDSMDVTLDDHVIPDGTDVPIERVRWSYDAVAATYATDLADEILALGHLEVPCLEGREARRLGVGTLRLEDRAGRRWSRRREQRAAAEQPGRGAKPKRRPQSGAETR